VLLVLALAAACGREPVEVREASSPAPAAPAEQAQPSEPEVLELGEGLVVEVLERGTGRAARRGGSVVVHYSARVDGVDEPFDSSWSRGLPDRWSLSRSGRPRLLPGLVRGLEGLPAGTRCVVHIPAALGFGAEGLPAAGVPADAALVYEVKLLQTLP
jgi:peptidylprolyl isomerase